SPLDPATGDVLHGRDPVGRLEEPQEVVLGHAGDAGQLLEAERSGVEAVGVIPGAAKVDQDITRCSELLGGHVPILAVDAVEPVLFNSSRSSAPAAAPRCGWR
ncbi:MAG: hypothetical protein QOH64_2664, partial [Acidimicrobiaceae bacterium]